MAEKTRNLLIGACLTALFLTLAGPARAGIITIQPGSEGKDTYAYQGGGSHVNDNFGTAEAFSASLASNWQHESFIQFDLSDIPHGGSVQKAELSLYNYTITWANRGDCYVDVYGVTDSWLEGSGGTQTDPPSYDPSVPITWNNRPPDDGVSLQSLLFEGTDPPDPGGSSQSLYPNEWRTWDVTELVRAWHEGTSPNLGLVLKASSGADIFPRFRSSDFGTQEFRPMLVVTHVPEPATLGLLGSGGLVLLFGLRSRRKKR